jgi:hypothetical protein
MSSNKVIDLLNTLHLVSDYNNVGLTSASNRLTVDSGGRLTIFNTTQSESSDIGALVLQNGGLSINALTNATSVSNGGALTIAGGAAIAGDLIVGGTISYSNAAAASSTFAYLTLTATDESINIAEGALVVFGGISVQTNADATSITSGGGMTLAGGLAVYKNLYIGGTSSLQNVISTNITANNIILSNALVTNITTTTLSATSCTISNVVATNITTSNCIITSELRSIGTSNTIGNIFTTGGNVGINTNPTVGFRLDISGTLRASASSGTLHNLIGNNLSEFIQLQNTNASGGSSLRFLNNSGTSQASFGFNNANSNIFQNGIQLTSVASVPINIVAGNKTSNPVIFNASDNSISITATTDASDTSSGALKVSGGVGIVGDLYVGGEVIVNSPLNVTINNTRFSSNSSTGAMQLVGGLSINVKDTINANANSYTSGGGITLNGGLAISQDTFLGGVLDIRGGSNNMNPIKLQSLQISSNFNNGTSTVIQSGNSTRDTVSFTPIAFSGWNDQANPKLTINTNTIDIPSRLNSTNNSNTLGNIFTTGGNVGIGTRNPTFNLDVAGTTRITTSVTTGALFSTNQTTTNAMFTNLSTGTLNAGNLTTGNINFTGILSQNGAPYIGSQWSGTTGTFLYYGSTGNINVGIGTTNPQSTLDINGTLKTQNLIVSGTGGSLNSTSGQYVFNSLSLNSSEDASSFTQGGGLTIAGGLAVGKSMAVGQSISLGGSVILNNVCTTSSGTFDAINGPVTTSNITGLLFSTSIYRSFSILMSASISRSVGGNLNVQFTIEGIQRDVGWYIYVSSLGDSIDITFNITSTGQLQYSTSTTYTNWLSTKLNYQVTGIYITGGFNTLTLPSGITSINQVLTINNSTESNSNSTGSLIIVGGVGIAKTLNVGVGINTPNVNLGISSMFSGSFIAANNISSPTNITGLSFATTDIRYFETKVVITVTRIDNTTLDEIISLRGNNNDTGWQLFIENIGDTSGITFTITSSGQVQYISTNIANFSSSIFRYNIQQYTKTGTYSAVSSSTSGSYLMDSIQVTSTQNAVYGSNIGAMQILGGATIEKALIVKGSIQYPSGICKTQFYSSQNSDFSNTLITNSSSILTLATNISFTPINTGGRTSQIICQCFPRWYATGSVNDTFTVQLQDNASNILDYSQPTFIGASGGGGREPLKQLMGFINTTTISPITFNLYFGRLSGDDINYLDLTYTRFLIQQIIL